MKNIAFLFSAAVLFAGCGRHGEKYVMPDEVSDFTALFQGNCAGCHGQDGRSGAARPLNDPLFLAAIGKDMLRQVITHGVPRTSMPAFGNALTSEQINILVTQIVARWSKPADFIGANLPSYIGQPGDAQAGSLVFDSNCAECHSESSDGSILDPAFLDLVSDQSLRTTVIAGRSDRGMPNWRGHDHPLTEVEISNVVTWLASHRKATDPTESARLEAKGTKLPWSE